MNEHRHWKWFTGRIPEWVEKGLITSQQAGRLLAEVPDLPAGHSLPTRILIVFSALLFGLGIISFFAFNWQAMPKWLKLATVFTAFISVHGAGFINGRLPEKKTISEFFHLLGTFLFGVAIVLIAQIYHIDEHFPNGILLWSFGALLMAYGLNSTPQMLFYAVLLVVWQFMERSYDIPQVWAVGYASVSLIPFAAHKKHWFAVALATAAIIIVTSIQLSYFRLGVNGNLFFLGVLCLGTALLIRRSSRSCARPLEVIGSILYFSMLITLLFSGGVNVGLLKGWYRPEVTSLYFPVLIVTATFIMWAIYFFPVHSFRYRLRTSANKHVLLALAGFSIAVLIWLLGKTTIFFDSRKELAVLGMIFFNGLALIHGIALIFIGARFGRIGISFLGCLLVVIVILSRFVAFSDNLLIRSIMFTLAGAFILIIALKTSRVKRGQIEYAEN